ncbi:GLABROUS1 enhancer-binding protein-like [Vicia villosa]|uniref:GLABROUS1 enhancer-binding protein-like n=1 Tax=Vicia villosa TaxID=3911 RepID=UPI00273BFA04|nr:GLABROUS1 enhancer-binding protein-like [Vicia villosa]XP_058747241.1 GLABROUS1 enhancer-binding protein-like [Vicia villosa]XP_058747242.1 GLABROUS1 enhancer-binding protein-like [Vicia villosa]XP_058747243.1 GLABROUS1 enhancer-binding protein-like [Vicia villosa]XP_058747244.1 GLABROUS1 enhancer-binding protein-like [Vicia villosa]XP_058747245.1 GLABROUS1 enhancer-binding protein-like [Vicia villosa]XP_058747246.1 GLABROUS1 enhancer-binding protein-like [Vicia villosa]XP_058747247.1 GLA
MAKTKQLLSPLLEEPLSASSSEEDSSEDILPKKKLILQSKNPPPLASKNPKPPSSSESESWSESESETDSDSEPEPTPPVKPLASPLKILTTPSPAKAGTKRAIEFQTTGTKRAADNNGTDSDSSKRLKKKENKTERRGSNDEKEAARDSVKKVSAQRLFSEEDELAILKGLADFISTKNDPLENTQAFYNFVKNSIRADANKRQLRRKVLALKKKFERNDENFTKEHDQKAFELFKKIGFKKQRTPKKGLGSDSLSAKNEGAVKNVKNSLAFKEMSKFGNCFGLSLDAMEKGMELMGESKNAMLEEKWKKVQIVEMKLLMTRAGLVKEQASMILESLV